MHLANGRKWLVEHLADTSVEIEIEGIHQTVFMSDCKRTKIRIRNKCNHIIIDQCEAIEFHFDAVITTLEVMHSHDIHMACLTHVPTITIDSVDKIMIKLPSSSLDTQILSCKSTEMNVRWPDASSPGGFLERYLPQQLTHKIDGGGIISTPAVLY